MFKIPKAGPALGSGFCFCFCFCLGLSPDASATSLLLSSSIIGPSQFPQLDSFQLESLLGMTYGESESKAQNSSGLKTVSRARNLAASFAGPLMQKKLMAGLQVLTSDAMVEGGGARTHGLNTQIRPQLSLALNPFVSLGGRLRFQLGEESFEIERGTVDELRSTEQTRYVSPQLSFTFVGEVWEGSWAYEFEHRDDSPQNNSPSVFSLHSRYRLSSRSAVGLRFDARDFKALSTALKRNLSNENSGALMGETQWGDSFKLESAFQVRRAVRGISGQTETSLSLLGLYGLSPAIELGLQLRQVAGDADAEEYTLYPLSLLFKVEL